jgi:uncharacterized protein (TIRG00374 family)
MFKFKLLRKFTVRDLLGYSISALLLWYTFYKSGLRLSDIRLQGDQWYYFIAAIALFISSLSFYAIRAKLIWVNKANKAVVLDTYASLILGNFYNCLLPGNLGEGVRASHFSRKNGVTFSRALAATITEKWLDSQAFAILIAILFIIKPVINHYISYALLYTAIIVLILSIVHLLLLKNNQAAKKFWRFAMIFKGIGKFLFRLYSHTIDHLNNMKSNQAINPFFLLFAVVFIFNLMQFYLLQKAAGVSVPVAGLYSSLLVSLSMMIIAFIPSAPSNIGVLHYGVYSTLILAAKQYGITPSAQELQSYALFAVYVHLSFLIPELTIGTIFMLKERKNLF